MKNKACIIFPALILAVASILQGKLSPVVSLRQDRFMQNPQSIQNANWEDGKTMLDQMTFDYIQHYFSPT